MQMFSGTDYLKIDIASSFGFDKADWDDRIEWVDENIDTLEFLAQDADEPALYIAGVKALRDAQNGRVSGYPISLDACASGLQLLSVLTGCEASARLCGVVSTGHREDAYTNLYQAMCDKTGDAAVIDRKDTKHAIMTSLYASTAIPKEVFGEGELLKAFYETMETEAPGAWALNSVLQQLWQPGALSHDWIMPDNFHCHIKVETQVTETVKVLGNLSAITVSVNQGTKEGKSISPNIIHSIDGMIVREMHRRCDYSIDNVMRVMTCLQQGSAGTRKRTESDKIVARLWDLYQASGFLSARILDHLSEENFGLVDPGTIRDLITSMPATPFKLMSIHDCFRCLPNHANDLRTQYNELLALVAESDMLSFIAEQITGFQIPVTKAGNLGAKIREADYALS